MADSVDFEAAGLLEGVEEGARQERLRLLEDLTAAGFSVDELREAAAAGRLALLQVDRALRIERPRYTPTQIAEQSGLSLELLRRLWRALGLAEAEDTEVAFDEADLEAAKTVGRFHAAGLDDASLVLISQVIGHGSSRLSETLREIVGEALIEAGDSERSLGMRYGQAAEYMVPMLTPLLGYVLSVHLREQVKSDVVYQEELASGRLLGSRPITVCFADLVGFTRLGEGVAPTVLGSAGRRLTEMAVEVARPPVSLVKMIGDAAMLVAPEPAPLVHAGLVLVELTEASAEMPSVRVGLASGEGVAQSGDWFGAPVNLASRVAAVARPGSVLAAKEVRDATIESFRWSHAGTHRFRGIGGDVRVFRARALDELRGS
jgi:adenylate cyclase